MIVHAGELERLWDRLGPAVRRDEPLGARTTYRVGGPAALFVEVDDEAELATLRRALVGSTVAVLVLGRGSNLLVADAGFPGLVVQLGPAFAAVAVGAHLGGEPPENPRASGGAPAPRAVAAGAGAPGGPVGTVVHAGGAAGLPVVARRSVEAGLRGLEWAVGVPGSVGGGVRMNAGGHGSDIAACLVRYRWFDLSPDGEGSGTDGPERLGLGYRRSSVTATQVVLWAELAARPGSVSEGQAALAEIVRWRRQHQPGGSNAGSVFTNPPGDAAGHLVEAAGLKGFRMGSARVSEKHANFIQADPGGSADDVLRLIRHVQAAVARRCGVHLQTEVRLVGFSGGRGGAP